MRKNFLIQLFLMLLIVQFAYAGRVGVSGSAGQWLDKGDYVETVADNSVSVGSGVADAVDLGTGAEADVFITDDLEVDGNVDVGGTVTIGGVSTGDITIKNASGGDDPALIYDSATATDTDYWSGVIEDGGGDDNDTYQIGKGTAPGTTPLVTLNTAGNVGIGTTGPGAKLDVAGQANIIGNAGGNQLIIGDNAYYSATFRKSPTANGVNFWSDGVMSFGTSTASEKVYIDTSGNVGIGTTGPGELLHVSGGNIALEPTQKLIFNKGSGDNTHILEQSNDNLGFVLGGTTRLSLSATDLYGGTFQIRTDSTSGTEPVYAFLSDDTTGMGLAGVGALSLTAGATELMRLTQNDAATDVISITGNVGIGTTAPVYPLEIANANASSLAYQRTGVSAKKWGFNSDNSATYWVNFTDSDFGLALGNTGGVAIGTYVGVNVPPANTLIVGGNVGIGVTAPIVKFQVKPATNVNLGIRTGQLDASDVQINAFADGGNANVGMEFKALDFNWNIGNSAKMVMLNNGNVGIGTTGPTSILHVDQSSASGAAPVVKLDQADIDDSFIDFIGTSAADGTRSISSDTTEDSAKFGAIRIEINGVTKWIRIYDDES